MGSLGKLNSDLTFTQDSIPKHIAMLGQNLFSSDMTTFTDRFPRELEKSVVSVVHGTQMAERWDHIIASRSFDLPSKKDSVKYEVGNPMGLLSS